MMKIAIIIVIFLHANLAYCSPLINLFNNHKNDILFNTNNNNNINKNSHFSFLNTKLDFENDNHHNNNNNFPSLNDDNFDTNHHHNNNNQTHSNHDENDFDPTIYGNTDESFFEFANRRVFELQNMNRNLFDKAINSCPSAPLNLNTESSYEASMDNDNSLINPLSNSHKYLRTDINDSECIVGSYSFENFYGRTSDRLFLYDPFTIGLVSSTDGTLRLYSFNIFHRTLSHLRTKYFRNENPYDACTDKYKNIYIVFPDQYKIAKYVVNQTNVPGKIRTDQATDRKL